MSREAAFFSQRNNAPNSCWANSPGFIAATISVIHAVLGHSPRNAAHHLHQRERNKCNPCSQHCRHVWEKSDGLGSSIQHLNRPEEKRLTQPADTEPDCDALGHAQATRGSPEVAKLASDIWGCLNIEDLIWTLVICWRILADLCNSST